jgi:hypothetical protein
MAAPIISPVAIVLFLISNRFLLSTDYLQILLISLPSCEKQKPLHQAEAAFPCAGYFMARLWCFCQRLVNQEIQESLLFSLRRAADRPPFLNPTSNSS